ncbi:cobyric acid synthase [Clostridium sp. AM58-1XD]|nr:cobyric acid synthase [Clostridium sp. AM58-1XD]
MAKFIMVQGTMSNSGKSFVAAGLCRIFRQDGYKVAPFKAQNMALNSFVTEEGLEMGRAQVVQAEAAGIRPTVAMNPILLKPNSNMGSQVIVEGEILGNYSAAEYYKLKKELVPVVEKSLKELSDQYDVIVIEGAGSPAEINLKEFDIVNMGMAKMAGAPVILVGDIDRGGVFASLYGTVKLLDEEEQAIIKGIVINKFRGDVELLNPGLKMIEEKVGIPVIGVIPMEEIDIEEEDSLADRLNRKGKGSGLDIAVIHLPHISNFTDFAVLERMNGVSVRYVETEDGLGVPDAIIIPGTKNTMSDLKWLRDSGLAEKITEFARLDIPVIGICGGFQMLGKRLSDPYGVEEKGTMEGLGLLDAKTVFSREKVRTQARARILEHIPGWPRISGMNVEGYEIHMGITRNLATAGTLLI